MSNNEKFNALLNSCSNPRRTCNALTAPAEGKPNLWRVAGEIAKCQNPDMVLTRCNPFFRPESGADRSEDRGD